MKRLFLLLTVALVALVSCKKEDSDSSLEGRWNVYRTEGDASDYTFSLIFKGNKLDVYIIAWGEHAEGTYTYANNEVSYNITKVSKAWTDVSFDEKGNMISYSWMAGDMDKDTFELVPGYDWYPLSKDDVQWPEDIVGKFTFELTSATTATTSLMGGTAYKAK